MFSSTAQSRLDYGSVALWSGVVIVAAVILGACLLILKRRINTQSGSSGSPWTLRELTALRDSGELTIEQYERLKSKLISEVRRLAATGEVSDDTHRRDEPPRT